MLSCSQSSVSDFNLVIANAFTTFGGVLRKMRVSFRISFCFEQPNAFVSTKENVQKHIASVLEQTMCCFANVFTAM